MPPHDETSPVGPRSGSVRRPPSTRARTGGGGGAGAGGTRRPAAPPPDRRGTAASRPGGGPPGNRPPGSRPPAGNGGGNGRGGKGDGRGNGKGSRKADRTSKQRWKRRLAIALAALLGLFVLLGVFVGVVYATTDVPDPATIQASQSSVVYYGDGAEAARLGSKNRTNVPLAQVSVPARNAVLAAENRTFYSDPGISVTGIIRGAWNTLTGSGTQSGSTITQQYVKNAILQDSSVSFSRKFKELFLAVKLDNNYSKDQILENYLNTIYFGRSAYGIQAAAETYFGVPASQLTAQQGAVLAVLIRNPGYYDPAKHPQEAQARWGDVLDGMVSQKWLAPAERQASVYPPVLPRQTDSSLGMPDGPEGLVVSQAIKELQSKGYTDDQIYSGGLRITMTVSKKDEDAAINAVDTVMKGQKVDVLRQALVATDPKTGAVLAYYGGPKGSGDGAIDYAQTQRQPGSSMKPYTLATGLEQGISVDAIRNGANKVTFPNGRVVRNAGTEACAACSLKEAITESLNTVFYGEAMEVGPSKVRQTALAATGLPDTWWYGSSLKGKKTLTDPQTQGVDASIGIGQYEMRPVDQAVGFGTFADGGVHRAPYFVAKVTDSQGKVLLQNGGSPGNQVMPPDVAHDVTYALTGVAAFSHDTLAGGRPSASKTGTQNKADTQNDNTDAWMVGYTPSLSTAVWVGSDNQSAITTSAGRPIYGAGLPGQIWKTFMDAALKGTPAEKLPTSPIITGDKGNPVIPVPTATAAPTAASTPDSGPTAAATTSAAATTAAAPTSTAPTSKPSSSSTSTPPSSTSSPSAPGVPLPGTPKTTSSKGNGNGGGGPGGG